MHVFEQNILILSEFDEDDEELLLDLPLKKPRLMLMDDDETNETAEDLKERMDVIKQKIVQRKATKHTKPLTKADRRRMKDEMTQKRQKLQQLKNMVANDRMKSQKFEKKGKLKSDPDASTAVAQKKIYNKEGKLFFSKVEIEGEEKKKKKKGLDTNPLNNLQKLKKQKSKIKELIDSGDKVQAKVEKHKMLWKSAFDKTEGIKVKDNEDTLKKTIKNRKNLKKKSKEKWIDRKKKIDDKQSEHYKKREQNLEKRKTDNQKTKKKKAVKKGRVF